MSPIPIWFSNAIIDGLQRIYSLGLQGAPSMEVLEATTKVWIECLWMEAPIKWEQERDEPRLQQAFRLLTMNVDRWPTPRRLLDQMPRSPMAIVALPAPRPDRSREISTMIHGLLKSWGVRR